MMTFISWAIFGAIVGGAAKSLVPAKVPNGWLPTILIGVAGSVAGGLPFGDGPAGLVGSVIGACVVLYGYKVWSESNESQS